MAMVCKFVCSNIEDNKVTFETMYDSNLPEDERFCNATPWGKLETIIDNPKALEQVEIGEAYYINISKVPK
jgi:hypothetical protein